ncbi:MAG: DMT family transporter [SAR202 cluster bacterium]|nr:DMT family transporter [SAR202 cluster bacterium]
MLGAILTLAASFGYALNSIAVRRAMVRGSALGGVFVTVVAGVPLFALAALVTGQLFAIGSFGVLAVLTLMTTGVLHYVIGRYCNYQAVGLIGANRAAPVTEMQTLVSLSLAIAFLGERVTPPGMVGIALIVAAAFLVAGASRRPRVAGKPVPAGGSGDVPARSQAARGYLFAGLNALFWGGTPVLIRAGLGDSGLGIAGGLIAYAGAMIVLLPFLGSAGVRKTIGGLDGGSRTWLAVATVAITQGVMFRYMALAVAPVMLVVPLMRAGGIIRIPLTFLVNRRIESFDRLTVASMLISLAGGVILVLA